MNEQKSRTRTIAEIGCATFLGLCLISMGIPMRGLVRLVRLFTAPEPDLTAPPAGPLEIACLGGIVILFGLGLWWLKKRGMSVNALVLATMAALGSVAIAAWVALEMMG